MADPTLNEAQMEKLEKVFKSFDLDGSGAISKDELDSVIKALGIALTKVEIHELHNGADTNKNGEVEFPEFLKVMEHHLPKVGREGRLGTFGHLITRHARNGPPMRWVASKVGAGLQVEDNNKVVATTGGAGWGVQLFDMWLSASAKSYNTADVILDVEKITDGNMMVGVAGRNYFPSPWDAPLAGNKHCAVVHLHEGITWKKEQKTDLLLGSAENGHRIHLHVDMLRQELAVELLQGDNTVLRTVTIDEIPPEATIAVCLGPGEQRLRIAGSSTEAAEHEFSGKTNKDLWDEDNVQRFSLEKKESSATMEAVAQSLE